MLADLESGSQEETGFCFDFATLFNSSSYFFSP